MNASLNPLDRLAAAKLWLISERPAAGSAPGGPAGMPYLAHALYAFTPVLTADVARMTCDEQWRVYVNPDWLDLAPVQEIAAEFPQLCEAEAHAFSRLLGVHVQRLATLAGGGHVCTTNIPIITTPAPVEGPTP